MVVLEVVMIDDRWCWGQAVGGRGDEVGCSGCLNAMAELLLALLLVNS